MSPSDGTPTQVGTGPDGQPIYQGNLNDPATPYQEPQPDATETESSDDGSESGPDESPTDATDATPSTNTSGIPNEDVVPIVGDSTSVQDQIYADPGLGDRGDPPPPEPNTDLGTGSIDDVIPITGDSSTPPPAPPPPTAEEGQQTLDEIKARSDADDEAAGLKSSLVGVLPLMMGYDTYEPPRPRRSTRLVPALVAAVVVVGAVVGFAATRSPEPSAAPIPAVTLPPAPTAQGTVVVTAAPTAASAARVSSLTFATPADGTSVCLQPVNFTLKVTLENAKAGDTVHVALTGPDMPVAGVTGSVDSTLNFATTVGPVGPVKGRQVWEATVDTINGRATAGIRATSLAICPN
jgi:hypothetical protein